MIYQMATWLDVAERIFPEITTTIEDLLKQYSERESKTALRFAPSPTGFLHIGHLATSLVGRLYATQQGGSFLLRVEDTDQKREVRGAASELIQSLAYFGVQMDE
jgi:glutamyl-tRNA synthetase